MPVTTLILKNTSLTKLSFVKKPNLLSFISLFSSSKMRILKRYLYILSPLVLILIINFGYARTNGMDKKTDGQFQEQDGKRKSDQTVMRPEVETVSEPSQDIQKESDNSESVKSNSDSIAYPSATKVDSVKDASISKYNFIFYLLYKFKYDAREAP